MYVSLILPRKEDRCSYKTNPSIRKATPHDRPTPVIAVKFINKHHAHKLGRVKPKQIQAEITLHSHVGKHRNIIEFLATGQDPRWTWIAMELAAGDLFDKIEADVGVGEDIAHFYFTQMIGAVSYMHSRGVAHRDIKPENILVSEAGDLKVGDFGLAVLFGYQGKTKPCTTVCGSPPYMAPEVVPPEGFFTGKKTDPYEGDVADVWSVGIVLFVLLVGNTPWDEPTRNSFEYSNYNEHGATDELWDKIPSQAKSLLRSMLRVDPKSRIKLEDVRRHPWFTRRNPHLTSDGRAANPVGLATQMLENLHIDFAADPTSPRPSKKVSPLKTSRAEADVDAMDYEFDAPRLALTQPETPITETQFDWERPAARVAVNDGISFSQPTSNTTSHSSITSPPRRRNNAPSSSIPLGTSLDLLSQTDPSLSQFSSTPGAPLSMTQQARKFRDILPAHSMARFLSFMDFSLLLPLLCEALGRLGIPTPHASNGVVGEREGKAFIPIKTRDQRNCKLCGTIAVEKLQVGSASSADEEYDTVLEVRFLKATGDPLEWRRLFKKVAVLCKDAILKPE